MKSQTSSPASTQSRASTRNNHSEANKDHAGQGAASLLDQRLETVAQTKLIAMMQGSEQVMQQQAISDSIHHGSRMAAQRKEHDAAFGAVAQLEQAEQAAPESSATPNHTGLPDNLKAGVEALSGINMDHVRVHYNSSKPAQLNAHAYAQGSEIHVAPGQERHIAHEAWHVVQQAQGRVAPTKQFERGVAVNDDKGLEREADVMGARAMGLGATERNQDLPLATTVVTQAKPIQCYTLGTGTTRSVTVTGVGKSRTFEECTYNSVEYNAGDTIASTGTATSSPAGWAGWLTNKKGGNNATQLHVVNKRWGGLGGVSDKNIVPGTPAENSHHLHEAEKKFDEACFGTTSPSSTAKAVRNAKYECWAVPSYGTAVNVAAGNVDTPDPAITVKITATVGGGTFPVTPSDDGLTFKQGT